MGRAAVFCRFAGCNLWTGREEDRKKAVCQFCDTNFIGTDGIGDGRFATAEKLAQKVFETWQPSSNKNARPLVVCTGGEPLLQLDEQLVEAFHKFGFEVAVETNGTNSSFTISVHSSESRYAWFLAFEGVGTLAGKTVNENTDSLDDLRLFLTKRLTCCALILMMLSPLEVIVQVP
jgi:hypothetical protein